MTQHKMASLIYQLLVFLLGAAQLISGYSYRKCIEKPKGTFHCIHRPTVKDMTAITDDLPEYAVNLVITNNTKLSHVEGNSFAKLKHLQNLRIDHNILSRIDDDAFQSLDQLKSLNLSFNKISELRPSLFKDLHNLTYLSLTNNNLKELPTGIFSSLFNLNSLIIRQNSLTDFSSIAELVSNLQNLTQLDLCFNSLTNLNSTVSLPRSLNELYVCRNNLSTLGCKSSFFQSVKLLDLSYNPMLPTAAFQGIDLSRLNYLRLRSTQVNLTEFLSFSNISGRHVDFSDTGLKNDTMLMDLCKLLRRKVKFLKNIRLGSNGIERLSDALNYCPPIRGGLDLSRNKLKSTQCFRFFSCQRDVKHFTSEHNRFTSLPSCKNQNVSLNKMEELSFRYNRILTVGAYAFSNTKNIKTLLLNINSIAFLHRYALKGLNRLETLRLDNNLLSDLFNITFEDNVNLKTLNLRNNRISVIFNRTFHNLHKLIILDLGGNKITHFEPSGLEGLNQLSKFYLDGNNLKEIDTSLYRVFQHTLTTLDLQSNQIQFLNEINTSPFVNLTRLTDLKLDSQRPYGFITLPRNFFRGLHSLKSLYLTNNNIFRLHHDAFDDLTSLTFLTLDRCCTGVTELRPGVFRNLKNLTKLTLENNAIKDIRKEVFWNLTELQELQLNRNGMETIREDVLESLSKLRYLDLRNIPLSCICNNSFLKNWTINNPQVHVVYVYDMRCSNDPTQKLYNFKTDVCKIDIGEYLFISTTVLIFLLTATPLLYVKLYWKIKYSYYVFRSWFSEQWRRITEEEENCKYDAFISYNSADEKWVMDQLLPNLEGPRSSFKLCLHHRDFELGRDIVDNIVTAVYSSRKTICVVSRNFLRSEWCSLEIQLASYRLFDEHRDVLLLVFLEPISVRQLSSYHRMRKIMLKKTYLQWPGSDCTDPTKAQDLFWSQLRKAIRAGRSLEREENYNREDCVTPEHETVPVETSDENYYLLP